MAFYTETRGRPSEVEPFGLLTEGAAGIAVIVLAIIALAGVSSLVLASIAAIVIGVGLTVQAFNGAAEEERLSAPHTGVNESDVGGEVVVECMCGLTGIVLGILTLVGASSPYLLPAALIIFAASLLLSGVIGMRPRIMQVAASGTERQVAVYRGSPAASGMAVMIGVAAIVLGILSVIMATSHVLVLVGFLAVGVALLVTSASFAGAALRLFATV
jgi:hypothetical protein